jgi:DNA (cytosine-5)-methyltransferase 1
MLRKSDAPTAVDLFCGAGGLSLGLRDAGFAVLMGIDSDPEAVETHRSLFPGISAQWDLSDPEVVDRVARIVRDGRVSLVAGGPPCQPFSSAGKALMRHLVKTGRRAASDERRELWQSFVSIVEKSKPPAVLIENVPEMALEPTMAILRAMVHRLEVAGYRVYTRLIETWRYGVPQFRTRLFVAAVRDGHSFDWPAESDVRVTVANAIDDLPEVEGGDRPDGGAAGWWPYAGPRTAFQNHARSSVPKELHGRVYDHITRPVREDDRQVFVQMDSKTRYTDIPPELRRYRDDIFTDKYKRLDSHDLSRTITAHISKDGYWYIHPTQPRTLTVREAARLQTFGDDVRFAGPPSSAFRQIGNAVPPLMGEHLGRAIAGALANRRPQRGCVTTQQMSAMLSGWFEALSNLRVPWLRAETRWLVILGELLMDRVRGEHVALAWPGISRLRTPSRTMECADDLREMASCLGRRSAADAAIETAEHASANPSVLASIDGIAGLPHVDSATAALAAWVVPGRELPPVAVSAPVLRVVARVVGERVDHRNRASDGRIATARLISAGAGSRESYLALVELGRSLCRPQEPLCRECPMAKVCITGSASLRRQPSLF